MLKQCKWGLSFEPEFSRHMTYCRIQRNLIVYLIFSVPFSRRRPIPVAKNLAAGKKTSQSSIRYGGDSKRAVDGKATTNYFSLSCTHTANSLKPWWKVDLGQLYLVSNVKITNRGDCCSSRLSNFDVKVDNKL